MGQVIDGNIFYQGFTINPQILLSLCVMKECVTRVYVALAVQKLSPLTTPFNKIILRLFQTGIIDYWQRDVIRRRTNYTTMRAIQGLDKYIMNEEPKKLNLYNLSGAFLLFVLGHLFSLCAFGLEIMNKNNLKRNYPILIEKLLDQ